MTKISNYIAHQPQPAQAHLTLMYHTLQQALPNAQERISYQMPAFWQGQVLVYFGAAKNFLGFYPTAAPIAEFASQLTAFHTSKGAIQFPYDRPLPVELIVAITQWRADHVQLRTAPTRRKQAVMPPAIATQLQAQRLQAAFDARPQYQQTDYLNWIAQAKREATKVKRLTQMLAELKAGDVYMKQTWHPGKK